MTLHSITEHIAAHLRPYVTPHIVGLDISDLSAKYLAFEAGNKSVGFSGTIDIPAGIIQNGEIKNESALVIVFRELVNRERQLHATFICSALPEEKGFLRLIQVPKVKHEEVENIIRWEIEGNIPLPVEELIYDYEIVDPPPGQQLDHIDVAITAFPKTIVEAYVRVLKEAGMRPFALEFESQAIIRAVVADPKLRSSYIIVDMGKNRTGISIFIGGSIVYTSTIPLGGAVLEENIAKELKTNEHEALEKKEQIGLNKSADNGQVFSALIPAVSILADELQKTIEYFKNHAEHVHSGSTAVDGIVLVGGDANLLGLDTYLSSILRIPAVRADPFAKVRTSLTQIPLLKKNEALAFATAIGLALRTENS